MLSKFDRLYARSQKGSLGALALVIVLPIGIMFGSLAVDFAHVLAVRNELQNAADAGALAGAADLWTALPNATTDALTLTAANSADGRSVSNKSGGTTVKVKVVPPTLVDHGTVEVDVSMSVNHLFAPMFGRLSDTISVVSIAGTTGNLAQLYADQAFPLAVSIDTIPRDNNVNGLPLNSRGVGDTFTLYINSQQVKNSAWTSMSTDQAASKSYIQKAIDQALGLAKIVPGYIPAITIGDPINLNNGVMGQMQLAKSPYIEALTNPNAPVLVLPVIEGDPSFNSNRPVVGFVGFKVTSVTTSNKGGIVETITGTIQRPQINGLSGPPLNLVANPNDNNVLAQFTPGPIQLIH